MTRNTDAGPCGGTDSNEVWMFGNTSEAAIVKVMRIREQLRPVTTPPIHVVVR